MNGDPTEIQRDPGDLMFQILKNSGLQGTPEQFKENILTDPDLLEKTWKILQREGFKGTQRDVLSSFGVSDPSWGGVSALIPLPEVVVESQPKSELEQIGDVSASKNQQFIGTLFQDETGFSTPSSISGVDPKIVDPELALFAPHVYETNYDNPGLLSTINKNKDDYLGYTGKGSRDVDQFKFEERVDQARENLSLKSDPLNPDPSLEDTEDANLIEYAKYNSLRRWTSSHGLSMGTPMSPSDITSLAGDMYKDFKDYPLYEKDYLNRSGDQHIDDIEQMLYDSGIVVDNSKTSTAIEEREGRITSDRFAFGRYTRDQIKEVPTIDREGDITPFYTSSLDKINPSFIPETEEELTAAQEFMPEKLSSFDSASEYYKSIGSELTEEEYKKVAGYWTARNEVLSADGGKESALNELNSFIDRHNQAITEEERGATINELKAREPELLRQYNKANEVSGNKRRAYTVSEMLSQTSMDAVYESNDRFLVSYRNSAEYIGRQAAEDLWMPNTFQAVGTMVAGTWNYIEAMEQTAREEPGSLGGVLTAIYAPGMYIGGSTGIGAEMPTWKGLFDTDYSWNELSAGINRAQMLDSGITAEQMDRGILGQKAGDAHISLAMTSNMFSDVIPQMTIQMVGMFTGATEATLVAMALGSAGSMVEDLRDDPNLTMSEKLMYGTLAGGAEYVSERIFMKADLISVNAIRKALGRPVKEVTRTATGAAKKDILQKAFNVWNKTTGSKAFKFVEEGIEEGLVSIADQTLRISAEKTGLTREIEDLRAKLNTPGIAPEVASSLNASISAKEIQKNRLSMSWLEVADSTLIGLLAGNTQLAITRSASYLASKVNLRSQITLQNKYKELQDAFNKTKDPEEKKKITQQLFQIEEKQHRLAIRDLTFLSNISDEDAQKIFNLNRSINSNRGQARNLRKEIDEAKAKGGENVDAQVLIKEAEIKSLQGKVKASLQEKFEIEGAYSQVQSHIEDNMQDEDTVGLLEEIGSTDPEIGNYGRVGRGNTVELTEESAESLIERIISKGKIFSTKYSTVQDIIQGLRNIPKIIATIKANGGTGKVFLHGTESAFLKATAEYKDEKGKSPELSRGLFVGENGDVHLFMPALKANTAYHEAYHAATLRNENQDETRGGTRRLAINLIRFLPDPRSMLKFVEGYLPEKFKSRVAVALMDKELSRKVLIDAANESATVADEILTEILASITEGSLSIEYRKGLIRGLLDFIKVKFGGEIKDPTMKDVVSAIQEATRKMEAGEAVEDTTEITKTASEMRAPGLVTGGQEDKDKEGEPKTKAQRGPEWDKNTKENLPDLDVYNVESFEDLIKEGTWGMLTAENPQNKTLSEEENESLNAKAKAWLEERGHEPQPIFGKYDNSENSFIVENLRRDEAAEFAREFNQESIATNEGIVFQDGSLHPINKGGIEFGGTPTNMYSTVKINGELLNVQVDYNWDEMELTIPKNVQKKLTEDEDGNYVFYHYSNERREVLKPRSGDARNLTSREEASAIAGVGGVVMFYTNKSKREPGVGDVQHIVRIPKERVYYLQKDHAGFYDKALEEFRKEYESIAFTPNHQAAWIAKVMKDAGYEMLVSNWEGNELRAQTVDKVTPESPGSKAQKIDWQETEELPEGETMRDSKIAARNNEVQDSALDLALGNTTNEEHREVVIENSPITKIGQFFRGASQERMEKDLKPRQKEKILAPLINKAGKVMKRIEARLDIPAYLNRNLWVVTIHEPNKGPVSYTSAVRLSNVVFNTDPNLALRVASGMMSKATFARMEGDVVEIEGKDATEIARNSERMIEEIANDPAWTQVGMNPFRHSYFWERSTGTPVVAADEVIQVGGLVYAKNVTYESIDSPRFAVYGEIKRGVDKEGRPTMTIAKTDKPLLDAEGKQVKFQKISAFSLPEEGSITINYHKTEYKRHGRWETKKDIGSSPTEKTFNGKWHFINWWKQATDFGRNTDAFMFEFDGKQIDVDQLANTNFKDKPRTKAQAVSEISENIEINAEEVFSTKAQPIGAFNKSYFEDEDSFTRLKADGFIKFTDSIYDVLEEGTVIIVHMPDNMFVGGITLDVINPKKGEETSESIIKGEGGVYYTLNSGNVWSSSEAGTNALTKLLNEQQEASPDGKARIVLVRGSQAKMISSTAGVKAAMTILERMMDRGMIPKSAMRSALVEVGRMEVEEEVSIINPKTGKKTKKKRKTGRMIPKYPFEFDGGNSASNIKSDIQKKFMNPDDTTFAKRGDFFADLVGSLSKFDFTKENKKKIASFLGTRQTSKGKDMAVSFSKAGILESIGTLLTERLLLGIPSGSVYGMIEVNQQVEATTEPTHDSYTSVLKQLDGARPILTIFNNRSTSVTELVTTKEGETFEDLGDSFRGSIGLAQRGLGIAKIRSQVKKVLEGEATDSTSEQGIKRQDIVDTVGDMMVVPGYTLKFKGRGKNKKMVLEETNQLNLHIPKKDEILEILQASGMSKKDAEKVYRDARQFARGKKSGRKEQAEIAAKRRKERDKLSTKAKNLRKDLDDLKNKSKSIQEFVREARKLIAERMKKEAGTSNKFTSTQIKDFFKIMGQMARVSAKKLKGNEMDYIDSFLDKITEIFDQQDQKAVMEAYIRDVKAAKKLQATLKRKARGRDFATYKTLALSVAGMNPALIPLEDMEAFIKFLGAINTSMTRGRFGKDGDGNVMFTPSQLKEVKTLKAQYNIFKAIEQEEFDARLRKRAENAVEKAKKEGRKTTFQDEYGKLLQRFSNSRLKPIEKEIQEKAKALGLDRNNVQDLEEIMLKIAEDHEDLGLLQKQEIIEEGIMPGLVMNADEMLEDPAFAIIFGISDPSSLDTEAIDKIIKRLSRLERHHLLALEYKMNDFLVNGKANGIGYIAAIVRGNVDLPDLIEVLTDKKVRSRKRVSLGGMADNLSGYIRNAFPASNITIQQIKNAIGLQDIIMSINQHEQEHLETAQAIADKIIEINKTYGLKKNTSIASAYHQAITQIYSMARQIPEGVNEADWYISLRESMETTLADIEKNDSLDKETREQYQEAYDFLFSEKVDNNSTDLQERIESSKPEVMEMADFMVELHESKRDDLEMFTERFLGKELEVLPSYTSFSVRKKSENADVNDVMQLRSKLLSNMTTIGGEGYKKVPGATHKREDRAVGGDSVIGLNFLEINHSTLRENSFIENTIGSVLAMKYAFNTSQMDDLMVDKVKVQLNKKIDDYLLADTQNDPFIFRQHIKVGGRKYVNPIEILRHAAVVNAFASFLIQFFKQGGVAVSTAINMKSIDSLMFFAADLSTNLALTFYGEDKDGKTRILSDPTTKIQSDKYELLKRSAIFLRDYKSGNIDPFSGRVNFDKKRFYAVRDAFTDKALWTLSTTDKVVAVSSFFAYYADYMKTQGLVNSVSEIDWKEQASNPNSNALAYADNMVEKDQNTSSARMAAAIYNQGGGFGRVFMQLFMPYQSFAINTKRSITADLGRLGNKESRADGIRGLIATSANLYLFHVASQLSLSIFQALWSSLTGDDDEEEKNIIPDNLLRDAGIKSFVDAFPSPSVSAVDDNVKDAFNYFLMVNEDDYDMPGLSRTDRFEVYKKYGDAVPTYGGFTTTLKVAEESPLTAAISSVLGMLGPSGKFAMDSYNSASTLLKGGDSYITNSGRERFIRPEDRDAFFMSTALRSILYSANIIGLGSKELDYFAKAMDDMPIDRALNSEEELAAYEVITKAFSNDPELQAFIDSSEKVGVDRLMKILKSQAENDITTLAKGASVSKFKRAIKPAVGEEVLKDMMPAEYSKHMSGVRRLSGESAKKIALVLNLNRSRMSPEEYDRYTKFVYIYLGIKSESSLKSVIMEQSLAR